MTLRRFIDVGYTILVEEYQRLGIDLLSAVEKVTALGSEQTSALGLSSAPRDPKVPDAVDNRRAMDALMSAMAGVKGAPV